MRNSRPISAPVEAEEILEQVVGTAEVVVAVERTGETMGESKGCSIGGAAQRSAG
jgi:hypothetical protein